MALQINKLVIFGVGLIGGSFALALKKANVVKEVVGIGRNIEKLERAKKLSVIDTIGENVRLSLKGADLVLLAVPVGQMGLVMQQITPHLNKDTVLTDAGSTKRSIVSAAYRHLPEHIQTFVPCHPIAGAETSGVEAAREDLFLNKKIILTPLVENKPPVIEYVRDVWRTCGATIHEMNSFEHDAIFAAVSHLPHVLAYTLVHDIASKSNASQLLEFAASGFRDFTRIASSHPEMWRDICIANNKTLIKEIDNFVTHLTAVKALIERANGRELEEIFAGAREVRNKWLGEQN